MLFQKPVIGLIRSDAHVEQVATRVFREINPRETRPAVLYPEEWGARQTAEALRLKLKFTCQKPAPSDILTDVLNHSIDTEDEEKQAQLHEEAELLKKRLYVALDVQMQDHEKKAALLICPARKTEKLSSILAEQYEVIELDAAAVPA